MADSNDVAVISTAVLEGGKLLVAAYFSYCKSQGLDEEQSQKIYNDSKAEFIKNNPASLPDAPE